MSKRKGIQRGMSTGTVPMPRQPVWPPPGGLGAVPAVPGVPQLGPIPVQPAVPFLQARGGAGGTPPDSGGAPWSEHVEAEAPNYWAAEQRFLQFENPPDARYGPIALPPPAGAAITSRAIWSSPLFDLRSDLLASAGVRGNVTGISADILFGINLNLFLNITGIGAILALTDPNEYQFYSMEFVAPVNPNNQFFISRDNITADILSTQPEGFLLNTASPRWRPEGPIRYWGVALVIDQWPVAIPSAPPTLIVDGALH